MQCQLRRDSALRDVNAAFKSEWEDDSTLDAFIAQVEREIASYDPAAYKRGCVASSCRLSAAI